MGQLRHPHPRRLHRGKNGDPSKIWLWDNGVGDLGMEAEGMPGKTLARRVFWAKYPKEKMLGGDPARATLTVNGATIKTLDAIAAAGTPALVVEPGRSIVGDAGMTFLRTAFVKQIAGIHHDARDGDGRRLLAEAIVGLPAISGRSRPSPTAAIRSPFDTFVAGNLCFNADMLSRHQGAACSGKPVRGDIADDRRDRSVLADLLRRQCQFLPAAGAHPDRGRRLVELHPSPRHV